MRVRFGVKMNVTEAEGKNGRKMGGKDEGDDGCEKGVSVQLGKRGCETRL